MPDNFNMEQGGVRYDQDKPRYELIPPWPLEQLARVYTMGAAKYNDYNWMKGMRWGRHFAAMMRHCWAFWRGETYDPESGLHHLAHAAFACFALMQYTLDHPELDDRPKDNGTQDKDVHQEAGQGTPQAKETSPIRGVSEPVFLAGPYTPPSGRNVAGGGHLWPM
jgi:hypothetical protein